MRPIFIFGFILMAFSGNALAQDAVPERRLILHRDVDFPGGDLRSIFDTSLEACESACLAQTQCGAFTYNTRNSSCFLKSGQLGRSDYAGAFSGEVVART